MNQTEIKNLFTKEFCREFFPAGNTDRFFEALYGDVSEGAYDISLECVAVQAERIELAFRLQQRPGKCLVCSLTYGLPNVFERHPIINIKGIVQKIKDSGVQVTKWRLGKTIEKSSSVHVIPLYLEMG
jgi:hypothetical protein